MTPALWTLFGFGLGIGGSVVIAYLLLTSKHVMVVDRWWLDNAERWEWRREYERRAGLSNDAAGRPQPRPKGCRL